MIYLIALLTCCSGLLAQSSMLTDADSLFRAGDYERVELIVLRAERMTEIAAEDLIGLHLLGGYSMIMLERSNDARRHFRAALDVDSSLTLDPVTVSPKFRIVFDDEKRQWHAQHRAVPNAMPTREVTTYTSARRESHLFNLLLPGAGFLREGKVVRGTLHLVVQATATALWLSEITKNNSSRQDYLEASSSSNAAALYDTYDSHHRRMWTFGLTTAALYIASQADLALWRSSAKNVEIIPTDTGARLQITF